MELYGTPAGIGKRFAHVETGGEQYLGDARLEDVQEHAVAFHGGCAPFGGSDSRRRCAVDGFPVGAEPFAHLGKPVYGCGWQLAVGLKVMHTSVMTEPIGPKKLCDLLLIAPCTGNTLAKLSLGVTDTSVTMAAKSHLRILRPVLLCLATNDALGASAQNIGRLLNTKNVYFVPLSQDDCIKKPNSLVADFDKIPQCVEAALRGEQIQPVFE